MKRPVAHDGNLHAAGFVRGFGWSRLSSLGMRARGEMHARTHDGRLPRASIGIHPCNGCGGIGSMALKISTAHDERCTNVTKQLALCAFARSASVKHPIIKDRYARKVVYTDEVKKTARAHVVPF
ncbi:hypothetical protein MRX96_008854 [Rhipicephalus microplus]